MFCTKCAFNCRMEPNSVLAAALRWPSLNRQLAPNRPRSPLHRHHLLTRLLLPRRLSRNAASPVSPAFQRIWIRSPKACQQPTYVPELNCYQFYTERFSAALAKMKQFYFLTENNTMDFQAAKAYSAACMTGLEYLPRLPRGFQTGGGGVQCNLPNPGQSGHLSICAAVAGQAHGRLEMPVVVELSTKNLYYCTKKPFWGFAMWGGIRKTAEAVLR